MPKFAKPLYRFPLSLAVQDVDLSWPGFCISEMEPYSLPVAAPTEDWMP